MKKISFLFCIVNLMACTGNLFDEIADKDTDEAIYFQAKQEINSRNYTLAITLLESLDPTFLSDRERTPIYASAYSGRCGLEFLTLLENLQDDSSSGTILSTLMVAFPGAALTGAGGHEDCTTSMGILNGIGNQSVRDGDENLLMAFTALSRIGAILSAFADNDNDGAADAGFDQCDTALLPEDRVREIGASLATAILSLGAIGTSYIDGALSDFNTICALDANLAAICNTTDPDSFSDDEVRYLRYAIGSNDYGIDSCGGNDFVACAAADEVPGPPTCL